MRCPNCQHDNLQYCGTLPNGQYRYQCPSCKSALSYVRGELHTKEEPLEWIAPFASTATVESFPVAVAGLAAPKIARSPVKVRR